LVLIGRNSRSGTAVAERICSIHPDCHAEFVQADLSRMADVRRLGESLRKRLQQVDILINNAGARFDEYQETEDGLERTFATNHLSHFLLTAHLLERLLAASSARIITVASSAHEGIRLNGDWNLKRDNYNRKVAYGRSKLANLMFAYELARRLRETRVSSNAVDPGGVATNLGRNNGLMAWVKHLAYYALKRELLGPRKGSDTMVWLALSNDAAKESGRYFRCRRPVESSAASHDIAAARALWRLSLQWTGVGEEIGAAWRYLQQDQYCE
jgi:NAD(P)-dependent dehydrogenase (short-subunit alcohol dehydrogenase family)